MLESLLNKKASFNAQMKQAEITYQQLTGALHVVEEMIKVEQDRLEKEKADTQLQEDANMEPDLEEGEQANDEAVN